MAMERLTEVLGGLPRVTRRRESRLALLAAVWPRAAGERLAALSRVVAFDRGRVRIEVDDALWAEQLRALRSRLIERLAAILPSVPVKTLTIRAAAAPAGAVEPARPAARPEAAPAVVIERAAGLEPELREALLKTAGAYLARRRRPA